MCFFFSVLLMYFGSTIEKHSITMRSLVSYVSSHVVLTGLQLFTVTARIDALSS